MLYDIDPRSPTPIWGQLASRIRIAVASGELRHGEALPSVREMARRLRVNPATVAQAYRELAREGFVESRHGTGTFVTQVDAEVRLAERGSKAREMVRKLLQDAARLGLTADELARAFASEVGTGAELSTFKAAGSKVGQGTDDSTAQVFEADVEMRTDHSTTQAAQPEVGKGTDDERN